MLGGAHLGLTPRVYQSGETCDGGNWFGWPCDEELAKLRLPYLAAKERRRAEKGRLTRSNLRFLESAPYAYPGQYLPPVAYRKDRMKGPIGLGSPVFWNIEKPA